MSLPNMNVLNSPMNLLYNNNNNSGVTQQDWEYIQTMKRKGYQDQQAQQPVQSDPYTDFENEFVKCTSTVQNKVLNDKEFKNAMENCDKIIQSTVEAIVRPQVLQTSEGRMSFEKMLAIFRELKNKYSQEETQRMEEFQKIMQDEVVQKRLAELQKVSDSKGDVSK